jgi:DNA (cytosine-5)-methyltransferase 1
MADNSKMLPVISLFSGAMGLDLGLEKAFDPEQKGVKFEVRVAVECNPDAVATIKANRPNLPLIPEKIEGVTTEDILKKAGLEKGEAALVVGGHRANRLVQQVSESL